MSNYSDVKNIIHNDLGITKEYVDSVIKKTVEDRVAAMINDESYITSIIENCVKDALRKKDGKPWRYLNDFTTWIENEITQTILEEVKNKVQITLTK